MIELCMSPIVKHSLSSRQGSAAPGSLQNESENVDLAQCTSEEPPLENTCKAADATADAGSDILEADTPTAESNDALYLTPAASCYHITFAVAAEYALSSAEELRRLLDSVVGSSLTIFSGVGSLGITPEHVQALIMAYGKRRCFLDLRVSKPWRNCTQTNCSIQ